MRKSNIYNAQNLSRRTAIHILEDIAEYMKDEEMFDCQNNDGRWYDLEDMLTTIIEQGRAKDKDKIKRRNKQIKDLIKMIENISEEINLLRRNKNRR